MTVTDFPRLSTAAADPAAVHAGLVALAKFIADHPGLPLASYSDVPFRVPVYGGNDEDNRTEVDRIAAILGVTARWDATRVEYSARREFGGGIAYVATAITAEWMAGYVALETYRGAVQPESQVAA